MIQALIAVPINTYWRQIAKNDPEYDTAEEIDGLRYLASENATVLQKLIRVGAMSPEIHKNGALTGTRMFSDHKLINLLVKTSVASKLQDMIKADELDWTVLAYIKDGIHKKGYNSVIVLKFMRNIPVYTDDVQTGWRRPVDMSECCIWKYQGLQDFLTKDEYDAYIASLPAP